ncbi:MAG: 2-oxo acid dehydrogenase subunit E2 [Acidobacteria bacterium]|nr:2-oxo acid dehydrogenase subunit E2 [Acidobacteriota bacterium]
MASEFKVPELGENVEKGDVVRVMVKAGDVIAVDQPVFELETDKATIEVPSTVAGTVVEMKIKQGDKVKPGQVVLTVDADAAAPAEVPKSRGPEVPKSEPESRGAEVPEVPKAEPKPAEAPKPLEVARPAEVARPESEGRPVPAAPSTRRFARELGVDISQVPGSGPGGRIGQEDVKAYVKTTMSNGPSTTAQARGAYAPLPDFAKWGSVESKPMSNIRRKTAEHLSNAWMAPHVTQNDKADLSGFEAFRDAYGTRVEKAGGKLTITAVIIKILAAAMDKYPQFASSVDMANGAIVFKSYRHIGVAVDTPNGLLVPVLRDVNTKTITQIAVDLASLSQKARDKKLSLDEMSGGVMTVTNLGGIGGTSFTPIVNMPEVAILGMSRGSIEPVWDGSQFVPKQMLPLSLSYDHRVIDGADAARFLRFIVEALESPLTMVL